MAAFAVIAEDDRFSKSIKSTYPDDNFRAWPGLWFVVDNATTQEVAKKLGIGGSEEGRGVVLSVNNYWGRAPKSLWEWLSNREA